MKYTRNNRGKIQNRERARQLIDFSGLRYGSITPTDIDGFIERGGRVFIFYEYKLAGAKMPHGQELALTRLVNALTEAGKLAVLFQCEHEEHDTENDICGASSRVERVYWSGRWYKGQGYSVKEYTDRYIMWIEKIQAA